MIYCITGDHSGGSMPLYNVSKQRYFRQILVMSQLALFLHKNGKNIKGNQDTVIP